MSWSGKTTIAADEITDIEGNPITEKKYLQLLSTVTDKAGNEQTLSHGWFVWWPDADKPWVDGFGVEKQSEAQERSRVYPGSSIQGQAYDNNSVHSVSYKIYNIDNGRNELVAEDILLNEPLEIGMPPSAFFNWTIITSPEKCAVYKIVIDSWDAVEGEDADGKKVFIKGNKGVTVERYFYVYDIDAPSITLESPSAQDPLFGDENGNFTVSGIVGDGVEPVSLRMVWLNPNADVNDDSRILYQSAEYDGWKNTAGKDTKGNLIWDLELGQKEINPDTERAEKTFSKSLNLFTDLNVGAGTDQFRLTAQSFILRVEGDPDSGRAVTSLNSVRGDIQPPSLSIEKIRVEPAAGEVKNYTTDILKDGAMDFLTEGDNIYLSGTWNDDSAEIWKDAEKMGGFTVSWNDKPVNNALLEYDGYKGTWKAGPIAYQGEGSGHIKVSLQDLGNNTAQSSFSARINTFKPVLVFITSDKSDGAYKADEEINIYLEFNKEVTYTGSDTPFLTLNNGKRAEHDPFSNGTMRHIFTYTVASGDDTLDNNDNAIDLNVAGINYDSGTWTGGGVADMKIPTGKNLSDTKKIKIDTRSPKISKVESLNSSGYYNADKTLYLRLIFDSDIVFNPGTERKGAQLTLNSGTDASTEALTQSVSGQNSLLFTYRVKAGENTDNLSVAGFVLAGGATLTDTAGNSLIDFTVPAGNNLASGIIIDTEKPAALVIGANGSQNFFEIESEQEVDASVEYQVNGGDWLVYDETNVKPFAVAGTYTVLARQIDAAGNVSDNSNEIALTIAAKGPLLISFGGNPPGTYGLNRKIEISLNLREPVTVTGTPQLKLQFGGDTTRTAEFDADSNDTDKLKFSYVTQTGDAAEAVEIKSFNLEGVGLKTANGADVKKELADAVLLRLANKQGLTFYTRIAIDTSVPEFVGAEFDSAENKLTIRFSKSIFKGSGNITLTQVDDYLAPAVLLPNEYNRFGGDSELGGYYTIGTSNTDAAGKPDLTEKYILNFNLNTDDETVTNALKGQNADKVIIPVVSSAVTVAGDDNNTLEILLSGSYAFPVKGVEYNITFSAGLVRDELNNPVAGETAYRNEDEESRVIPSGINPVFIRINKEKARIEWTTDKFDQYAWVDGYDDNARISFYHSVQPINGQFKIDCQTPTAQLSYVKTLVNSPPIQNYKLTPPEEPDFDMPEKDFDYTSYYLYTDPVNGDTYYEIERRDAEAKVDPTKPTYFIKLAEVADYTPNASVLLIPASFAEHSDFGNLRESFIPPRTDYTSGTKEYGFVIGIMARAIVKDGDNIIAEAEPAYEKAARSTVQFNFPTIWNVDHDDDDSTPRTNIPSLPFDERNGYITQLWIRGGDRPSGSNSTPGFPLSWDERDYSGIRLMCIENGHDWYWISWEVNETMYFHFLEGTTPASQSNAALNDLQNNGPIEWAWGQAGWAFQHDNFRLYPGSSLKFNDSTYNPPGGTPPGWGIETPNLETPFRWPGEFTGKRSGPTFLRRASR